VKRPANVVASAEVAESGNHAREKFEIRRKRLGAAAGGEKIGCSLIEVPPGKAGWPAHYHFANEEAVYVLEGEGVLRQGAEEVPLRAGDYVALRIGPPGHRIDNRSAAPLRYLAISTLIEPEVVIYPDSNKLGALARKAGDGLVEVYVRRSATGYWEGEE
jgi:uncharacterized cupin superfamily protein